VVNGATPDLMVVDELHTMDDAKLEVVSGLVAPDGTTLIGTTADLDPISETKAKVIALDASQRVLEADAFAGKLASMGRRRFRAMVFAKNRGDEKAKAKRVAKARAKSKVAKQSRKRNRS
jgi:hypothetical protein